MNNHIADLIKEKGNVIIPGLGSFGLNKSTGAPLFNEFLKFDDGVLKKHIAEKEGVGEDEALKKIESHVSEIKSEIDSKGSYDIPGIGTLQKDDKGRLVIAKGGSAPITPEPKPKAPKKEEKKEDPKKEASTEKKVEAKPTPPPAAKKEEKKPAAEKPTKEDKKQAEAKLKEEKKKEKAAKKEEEKRKKEEAKLKKKEEKQKKEQAKKDKPESKSEGGPKKEKKKKKRKFPLWLIILLVVLLLIGGGIAFQWNKIQTFITELKAEASEAVADNFEELEKELQEELDAAAESEEEGDDAEEAAQEEESASLEKEETTETATTPTPSGTAAPGGNFHVIVGCFKFDVLADRLVEKLKSDGHAGAQRVGQVKGLNAVSAGGFPSRAEAERQANSLKGEYEGAWVLKN